MIMGTIIFRSNTIAAIVPLLHSSSKGSSIYYVITDRGGGSPQMITDYIVAV